MAAQPSGFRGVLEHRLPAGAHRRRGARLPDATDRAEDGQPPVLRWNFGRLLRFLTIGSLAPVFREAMRLPWSAAEQRRFENLFLFVSYVNTFLPKFVRQGASRLLMGDLRTRISKNKPLV